MPGTTVEYTAVNKTDAVIDIVERVNRCGGKRLALDKMENPSEHRSPTE